MRTVRSCTWVWVSLVLASFEYPAHAADGPVIESAEGEKIVAITGRDQQARVGTVGTALAYGDQIKTGPRTSLKIRYPDGSKVLVAPSSVLEVLETTKKNYEYDLSKGKIRGLIQKRDADGKQFLFRTKAATLGVRGTDFVLEGSSAEAKAEVHTLKGAVEVAEDPELLKSGQGVRVNAGEKVDVSGGNVGNPQKFDQSEYLNGMKKDYASFFALTEGDAEIKRVLDREESPPGWAASFINPWEFQVSLIGLHRYVSSETGNSMNSFGTIEPFSEFKFYPEVSWNPEVVPLRWLRLRAYISLSPSSFYADGKDVVQLGLFFGPSFTFFKRWLVEFAFGSYNQLPGDGTAQTAPSAGVMTIGRRGNYFDMFNRMFISLSFVKATKYPAQGGGTGRSADVSMARIGFGF